MKFSVLLTMVGAGLVGITSPGLAHGVKIQYQAVEAIAVAAHYDSGQPMAEAQVLVYAPDNSTEPWLTGVTDKEGKFTFTLAGDRPGNWEVTVRQGGHGSMITIPWQPKTAGNNIGSDTVNTSEDSPDPNSNQTDPQLTIASMSNGTAVLSPLQRSITVGAVIWGFVGTALFFSRSKGEGRA
ncbi:MULTISPECIES: carboxypeptidase-like regulatory domain-containing protein [unclassified Synechocystis]|uniref:carboxypeptidase-like regulatory domain-containing protein n=1 Tax=unclassified Synechocystis TaxID=2640012 RepID=UPI000402C07A|nr:MULTISPECIES: carboxypeptidase-like regulatory domain-containing protein [unclassified Synechocystis]AIE74052.1 Additional component NikL of nickel ECF transporter [Synechocystis sp. PCC 6714]MCT0252701.1 carboxypeptidase-like regulatory domain-containing protein [Synechocystis sp. CS-94]